MTPTEPDERRVRQLLGFARMLVAYLDADPVVRQSVEAMARGLDRGGMSPPDRDCSAIEMDRLLIDEISRQHR